MRYRGALTACLIIAAGSPALAQQAVRILTPTADTCRAYTAAMVASDKTALTALAGWVVGYLSGFAQGPIVPEGTYKANEGDYKKKYLTLDRVDPKSGETYQLKINTAAEAARTTAVNRARREPRIRDL